MYNYHFINRNERCSVLILQQKGANHFFVITNRAQRLSIAWEV